MRKEFYCASTGSNLNSGTDENDAARLTYNGGSWVQSTCVFTLAGADFVADGVLAGEYVSVYLTSGATVAVFVGQVVSVDTTTVTVSTTIKIGTSPSNGTGTMTMKVGGRWKTPADSDAFPFTFFGGTAIPGDARLNVLAETISRTTGLTFNTSITGTYQGYASTPGDGGRPTFDFGASEVVYATISVASRHIDMIFTGSATAGTNQGIVHSGAAGLLMNLKVVGSRGAGIQSSGGVSTAIIECEVYNCNTSNTANSGGFHITSALDLIRCYSHGNVGSNNNGLFITSTNKMTIIGCIFADNANNGVLVGGAALRLYCVGTEFYNNAGAGLRSEVISSVLIENCNFIKNGTYGYQGQLASGNFALIRNCGFGSGTQSNLLGNTTDTDFGIVLDGCVTYAADDSPYQDAASGNFTIALVDARDGGYGAMPGDLTDGFPVIGAVPPSYAASPPTAASVFMSARRSMPIVASSSGNNELVAAVPGVIVRVTGFFVGLSAGGSDVAFRFRSASTSITGAINLPDGGQGSYGSIPQDRDGCLCQTAVGEPLNIHLSDSVAVGGWLIYEQVSVSPS